MTDKATEITRKTTFDVTGMSRERLLVERDRANFDLRSMDLQIEFSDAVERAPGWARRVQFARAMRDLDLQRIEAALLEPEVDYYRAFHDAAHAILSDETLTDIASAVSARMGA